MLQWVPSNSLGTAWDLRGRFSGLKYGRVVKWPMSTAAHYVSAIDDVAEHGQHFTTMRQAALMVQKAVTES